LTKNVVTIGPASDSTQILEQLIGAGMNVARFNTKHSDPTWHDERIKRVRTVADKLHQTIGILLDLQGPEIRIDLPNHQSFDLKKGQTATFTSNHAGDSQDRVFIPQDVIESLSADDKILIEDGACEFVVQEKSGDSLIAKTLHNCTVSDRKTMNTPGIILDMPSLTERDYQYLDQVDLEYIDLVGLSFVRRASDIEILRSELESRKSSAQIVAKIENQSALDHLDEIIEVADVVMVARGDLAVEVPYEQLIYWQKLIIDKCRHLAKPVITATQMLKSMVDNPRPTRAEVSDVTNAIYDGTDAVMLSEESTIGKYPVQSVQVQAQIAEFNELKVTNLAKLSREKNTDTTLCVTGAAIQLLEGEELGIEKVICLTETGRTARLMARFRPKIPIVALTSNQATCRKLSVTYGVYCQTVDLPEHKLDSADKLMAVFKESGVVQVGETVLMLYGTFWKKPGLTNTISIVTIH